MIDYEKWVYGDDTRLKNELINEDNTQPWKKWDNGDDTDPWKMS